MKVQFKVHDQNSAPTESKLLLEKVKGAAGIIPGLHAVLAESPEALNAYIEIGKLFGKSSLSNEEKTVVWQTINVEHECNFCVPAHTMMAKLMKVDEKITDALRNEKPLPTTKLEMLRIFTLILLRNRGKASDEDVSAFIDAGFTQKNILEVIVGISQKVMSNYTNYIAKTPLNKQFQEFAWSKK
jgi:alkylhydroperoxidase family enzyme